ncbi:MAG: BTAD domain-containing putative transcriptional regulator [Actinomycetota bacterium]
MEDRAGGRVRSTGLLASMGGRTFEIGVLGPLELAVRGRSVDPGTRKQRLLLLRLVAGRGRPVAHEQLVEALWGDRPPGAPEVSLRSYVSNLRKLLEPDRPRWASSALSALGDSYALTLEDGALDADRLAEDLREAQAAPHPELRLVRAERALRRWRGTPFTDADGAPFALALTTSWSALRREAMEERAAALLELGRLGEAVVAGQELVGEDRLAERGWAHLALAHYRSGRQADALAAIDAAREVLRDELGVDPGAELRELELRILDHDDELRGSGRLPIDPRILAPPAGRDVLVGREEELGSLLTELRRPGGGSAPVVVVTGAPGVGKTHLLDAALDDIGAAVLPVRVACDPAGGAVGLLALAAAVDEALEVVGDEEADVLLGADRDILREVAAAGRPAQGRVDPATDDPTRFHLFDGLARVLVRLSRRRPVVLVVEDAHWAGLRLWEFLVFFVSRRSTGDLAVVVTARPAEVDRAARAHLARIQSVPGAQLVDLGPLDEQATSALVVGQLGSGAAPLVSEIHRRSAGNALFARELVRALDPEDPVGSLARLDPPATLRQVIVGRIAELPEAADELLTVAALLGSPFDLSLAAAVADVSTDDAAEIAESGCRRGLLVEGDDRPELLAFRHDIVRETVEREVTRRRRARWHARIGERLADGADPDDPVRAIEVAHHLARGAPAGTALAAGEAALAAIRAAFGRHEPDLARRLAETAIAALDHAPAGTEQTRLRSRLSCELSTAARRLGDLPTAHVASRDAFGAAAELGDLSVMARAAVTLAGGPPGPPWWGFWSAVDDAADRVQRLLDAGPEALHADELVLLWCARASDLSRAGRHADAEDLLGRAMVLAEGPLLETVVSLGSWRIADLGGSAVERAARGREVLDRARAADFAPGMAVGHRCLAGSGVERGDLPAARRELNRIEAVAQRHRSEAVAYDAMTLRTALDLFTGRLADAERGLIAALERFGHFGRGWLGVLDLQFVRLFYEQHRMHLLEAQLRQRIAEDDAAPWNAGLVTLLTAHDRHDEAREVLAAMSRDDLVRSGEPAAQFVPSALFADAVVDLDDRERAEWLVAELEPRADRLISMSNGILFSGWLCLPVGRLLGLLGDDGRARHHLLDARRRAEEAASPLFELRARVALAELDVRAGRRDDDAIRSLLDEATAAGYGAVAASIGRLSPRSASCC